MTEFYDAFESLGARFDTIANNTSAKPAHVEYDFNTTTVQAARLLGRAVDAGWLPGIAKLRETIASFEKRLNTSEPSGDTERALRLWTHAISSWLAKECPDELRPDAKSLDWAHWKPTAPMEPVGFFTEAELATQFAGVRAALEHFRLPDGRVPKSWARPEGSVVHDEGRFGEHDWDSADQLHRKRLRAANYADVCRLLAGMLANTSRGKKCGVGGGDPSTAALADVDMTVLQVLGEAPHSTRFIREIVIASGYRQTATKKAIKRLEEQQLIGRPQGTKRRGLAVTDAGLKLLTDAGEDGRGSEGRRSSVLGSVPETLCNGPESGSPAHEP